MANTARAPKQWSLSKTETINSFENWKQNLSYTLSLDSCFAPFLAEDATWGRKTKAQPLRGFEDDGEDVRLSRRHTAQQKVNFLELMLGQIANYCPVISRNTLVKNSTSIQFVWNTIREHFGFQITGAHFLDFANLHLEADERPEDLYQRLMAFVDDTLLRANSLSHHGEVITDDEELTPTLENFIVLTWLRLIHPELPKLVKQRYGTELRSRTLASIKPEISQALTSLLAEIRTADDAKIMRTAVSSYRKPIGARAPYKANTRPDRPAKSCPLCKQAGRPDSGHFLSECSFLPDQDRKYIAKARQIANIFDQSPEPETRPDVAEPDVDVNDSRLSPNTKVFRIQTRQSPYLDMFHSHLPVRLTIDSGATGNMIRHTVVQRLGCHITPSSQSVHQADGSSPLNVVGETRLSFTREGRAFTFEGLVVKNLDVDVLAGAPFMEVHDIAVRPAKRQVILNDGSTYYYGSPHPAAESSAARRALVLRSPPTSTTVWPGEFIEVNLPSDAPPDSKYALKPRTDAPSVRKLTASQLWPTPGIVSSVAGKIRIPNPSSKPHFLKRNEHFCQVRPIYTPETNNTQPSTEPPPKPPVLQAGAKYSTNVRLDPHELFPRDVRAKFTQPLDQYDHVFDPHIKDYNGAEGPSEVKVNMDPVEPPQRKGRLPQYARTAAPCEDEACQVCTSTKLTQESVVRRASIQDVLSGDERLPFTSRTAWLAIQAECADLRRTRAHLEQGTRPSKKLTNTKDVKRYLNVATIATDGLLVVKRDEPLARSRECIIVPRQVLEGRLTALHIQLSHPSCHQLKAVTKRYLYALDMDKAIDRVSQACHHCAALRKTPNVRVEQSSCPSPDPVGVSFAADVIKKAKAPVAKIRPAARIAVGDLAYLHSDRNKTRARDRYLVLEIDDTVCNVRKFIGSQLRSTFYRVTTSECYRVPSEVAEYRPSAFNDDADSSSDETPPAPPSPPVIPSAISTPATQEVPSHDDLAASRDEPCNSTAHPDPEGGCRTCDNDSDAPPPPRRPTRKRRSPACYDFVTDFSYPHS